MIRLTVRCYAELNDHLPPPRRYVSFDLEVEDASTVWSVITASGVPTDEVDLVLLNGTPVSLDHVASEGDRVSAYPVFESFDVSTVRKLEGKPLRTPRFVCDVHLGKLANHLRLLGFDTRYENDFRDSELLMLSSRERRALLSKDRKLLQHRDVVRGYLVKDKDPRVQLIEVIRRFDLSECVDPFTRCIECNSLLKSIAKQAVLDRVPARVKEWCNEYQRCETCDRIYWQGSHYEHMKKFIADVLKECRLEVGPSFW